MHYLIKSRFEVKTRSLLQTNKLKLSFLASSLSQLSNSVNYSSLQPHTSQQIETSSLSTNIATTVSSTIFLNVVSSSSKSTLKSASRDQMLTTTSTYPMSISSSLESQEFSTHVYSPSPSTTVISESISVEKNEISGEISNIHWKASSAFHPQAHTVDSSYEPLNQISSIQLVHSSVESMKKQQQTTMVPSQLSSISLNPTVSKTQNLLKKTDDRENEFLYKMVFILFGSLFIVCCIVVLLVFKRERYVFLYSK